MPHEHTNPETRDRVDAGDQPTVVTDGAGTGDVRLGSPSLDDGRHLWRLAGEAGLDLNSPYAYLLWCRDFARTSVAAHGPRGELRGFVTGYLRPQSPATYFLWQVAVDPSFQGRRLARRMLDHIADRVVADGTTHLEATVTPDNTASRALFASFARDRGAHLEWTPLFEHDHFPHVGTDNHEPEELVRIGPLR